MAQLQAALASQETKAELLEQRLQTATAHTLRWQAAAAAVAALPEEAIPPSALLPVSASSTVTERHPEEKGSQQKAEEAAALARSAAAAPVATWRQRQRSRHTHMATTPLHERRQQALSQKKAMQARLEGT